MGGLWHCFNHITQFVRQKIIRVFEWFWMHVFFWCEQLQGLQIVSRSLCGGHFLQRDSRPDDARSELPDHSDGWLLQMKPDGSEAWAVDESFKTGRLNAITEVKMPEKERERVPPLYIVCFSRSHMIKNGIHIHSHEVFKGFYSECSRSGARTVRVASSLLSPRGWKRWPLSAVCSVGEQRLLSEWTYIYHDIFIFWSV